jgi:chitin synthase
VSRLGRRSLSRTHGGRPSRKGVEKVGFGEVGTDGRGRNRWMGWWPMFYTSVTCCCPNFLLSRVGGMHQSSNREAWREKVGLCVAIAILCGALAFLTFGFSLFVCQPPVSPVFKLDIVRTATDPRTRRYFIIHGQIYNIPEAEAKKLHPHSVDVFKAFATQDLSAYFPFSPTCPNIQFSCRSAGSSLEFCHKPAVLNKLNYIGDVAYEWKDIEVKDSTLVVYNGEVLDLSVYLDQVDVSSGEKPFGGALDSVLRAHLGKDASRALSIYDQDTLDCLFEHFRAGLLDVKTMGCVATDIVLYVSLVVILSLVFTKFFLAIGFAFVMSRRLGRPSSDDAAPPGLKRGRRSSKSEWGRDLDILATSASNGPNPHHPLASANGSESGHDLQPYNNSGEMENVRTSDGSLIASALKSSRYAAAFKRNGNGLGAFSNSRYSNSYESAAVSERLSMLSTAAGVIPPLAIKPRLDSTNSASHMYTILLVTCYSEDEAGLRTTLDSLTSTDYDDNQKLLFVVADGIIKGSGNDKSTPDLLIGMMEMATDLFEPYYFDSDGHPLAHSYVAIADGTKRHNMARVYPGYYRCGLHRIPMILVVKCGTPAEAEKPKPGNRGKRDSQIIIMSFLNKCLFDDRMTPLDYDLFYKITRLTGGVTPENYELILMVDADTRVMPPALAKLVQVMRSDETIMGCCGETRISNKSDSWVTAIQVRMFV